MRWGWELSEFSTLYLYLQLQLQLQLVSLVWASCWGVRKSVCLALGNSIIATRQWCCISGSECVEWIEWVSNNELRIKREGGKSRKRPFPRRLFVLFRRGASANGIWHAACQLGEGKAGETRGKAGNTGDRARVPGLGMPIYIESSNISRRVHQNFKLLSELNGREGGGSGREVHRERLMGYRLVGECYRRHWAQVPPESKAWNGIKLY